MKQFLFCISIFCFLQSPFLMAQNDPCGQMVRTSDTTVFPGSPLLLTISGDNMYACEWRPNIQYPNYENWFQTVTPSVSTDYYVIGFYKGNSVVTNGNFSSGNTGFTSQYTSVTTQGGSALWNEGTYAVGTHSNNWHQNFPDYLGNPDNYMIVNGNTAGNATVWSQTITVQPNLDYIFDVDLMTIIAPIAQLQFSINNALFGQIFSSSTTPGDWNTYPSDIWNSGTNTSATIKIVNQNTAVSGNDFGLDNISFQPVIPCYDTIRVTVVFPVYAHDDTYEMCQGETLTATPMNNDSIHSACINDSLSIFVLQQPQHGQADFNGRVLNCSFNEDFSGVDSMVYVLKYAHFYDTASVLITVHPRYDVKIYDTICAGYNYNNHGFTVSSSGTTEATSIHETNEAQTIFGCDSIVELYLAVTPVQTSIVQISLPPFCDEESAVLQVNSDLHSYLWSTGDTTPQITVTRAGTYTVTTSEFGCESNAAFSITPCEYTLNLPNTFTPSNADGLNDFFYIPGNLADQWNDFSIAIYNRFGELSFFSTDKAFQWDGTYKGQLHPNAVYQYVIKCTNLLGRQFFYKGKIMVL